MLTTFDIYPTHIQMMVAIVAVEATVATIDTEVVAAVAAAATKGGARLQAIVCP